MPRSTNTELMTIQLPNELLDQLRALSEAEQTPVAELLRRVGDLVTMFDFRQQLHPFSAASKVSNPARYNFYIGAPLAARLHNAALAQNISVSELLRCAAELYLSYKNGLINHERDLDPGPDTTTPDLFDPDPPCSGSSYGVPPSNEAGRTEATHPS